MIEDNTADIVAISERSSNVTTLEVVTGEGHTEELVDDATGMTAEEFLTQEFTW